MTYTLQPKSFSHEFSLIKTSAVGTLLFKANYLFYKPQNDLSMYKKNELESAFVEILSPKKANVIAMGSSYKHISIDLLNLSVVLYASF